ncbi:unnamed protein product [Symbiodinium sp. CCMP2592]|nr:unnamed protein product [Symbiodinium sp. CCMP2592]
MSRLLLQCLLLWPSLVASLQIAISSLEQKAAASVNVATTPCHHRQIPGSSVMTSVDFDPILTEELNLRNLKNVARLPGNAELLVKAMQQDTLVKQLAINNPVLAHVISSPDALKKMVSQEVLGKVRCGQVSDEASVQAVLDLALTKPSITALEPEPPTLASLVERSRQTQTGNSIGPTSENSDMLLDAELQRLNELNYIYADLLRSFWQIVLTLEAAKLVIIAI